MLGNVLKLILALFILGRTYGSPKADAAQQIIDILNEPKSYNKDILPYPRKSGPIVIHANMYVRNVEIIPEKMEMKVELTFRMEWEDPRLLFSNPGVPYIRFQDSSKFWIPDAFFKNAMSTQYVTRDPEEFVQVDRKGQMLYSTRILLNARCPMNFKEFPFDEQVCAIYVASYGHSTKDIVFLFKEGDPVQISSRLSIVGYTLDKFVTDYCNSKTNTGEYSCLSFKFNFQSEPRHYVVAWYIPCILCVVVAFLSGLIEPSALLPRLFLTVSAQLFGTFISLAYLYNSPMSVSYTTYMGVFTGVSLTAIFATLLHVLISYRCLKKCSPDEIAPLSEGNSKLKKICSKAKQYINCVIHFTIVGIYCLFLIIYCLYL